MRRDDQHLFEYCEKRFRQNTSKLSHKTYCFCFVFATRETNSNNLITQYLSFDVEEQKLFLLFPCETKAVLQTANN